MTDPEITVKNLTPPIPVRLADDGRPCCPCCSQPMVEVEAGRWACPDWEDWVTAAGELLRQAAERLEAE